jgi:hypothetical protein
VFIYGLAELRQATETGTVLKRIFDNEISPFYALFVCVWSTMFLEFWKRRNVTLSYRWSTMDYEKSEAVRADFKPTHARISPITGKYEMYFPETTYSYRKFVSTLVTIAAICVVLLGVCVNIIIRVALANSMHPTGAMVISSIFALVTLILLDQVRSELISLLNNVVVPRHSRKVDHLGESQD